MVGLVAYVAQAIFFLVVVYFALYVLLEVRVLFISHREERRKLAELKSMDVFTPCDFIPRVSVLLPVCNEAAVVERLIEAACRLQYPAKALEILVLDDSTDNTSDLIKAKVNTCAAQGSCIQIIRRMDRQGYKAGNLVNGVEHAKGEFFVIFDADFVPPDDFLLKTSPCFKDPALGFLQTGIGYENRDKSFLTRFQAMEMEHQQYVTDGLSADGDMASLSGSSCVWRKTCVESLGGWNASTVTEDVDLGYRAQLDDWKYAYLRDVVSLSVLPETISAFRVQRERWGRGLIHSAFKHVRLMFRQRMPLMKRLHAISMMFSSVLLASIYVLVLLSLPLGYLTDFSGMGVNVGAVVFYCLVAVWAFGNTFGASKGARSRGRRGIFSLLRDTYLYVALFVPMAWYYFAGGVRALFGVYGEFHRTPKGKDEHRSKLPRISSVLFAGDLFSFAYSALTIAICLQGGDHYLLPLNLTVCVGFGMTIFWSWQERQGLERA